MFRRIGELGFLGFFLPRGVRPRGRRLLLNLVLAEEIVHAKCGGLGMGIAVHTDMATPPVSLFGTEEPKQRYLVPSIKARRSRCLGYRAGNAGSDLPGT